jgi:hypothetical protein
MFGQMAVASGGGHAYRGIRHVDRCYGHRLHGRTVIAYAVEHFECADGLEFRPLVARSLLPEGALFDAQTGEPLWSPPQFFGAAHSGLTLASSPREDLRRHGKV